MLTYLFRRHSAPVLPRIETTSFTDIRPHPSPPTVRGWRNMKVFPKLPVETDEPTPARRGMGPIFSAFVYNTIQRGELHILQGLLCNPITNITPTPEMATVAVRFGWLDIVVFFHHTFGVFPTSKAHELALIRQDFGLIRFLRAWNGKKYGGSARSFSA